MNDLYQDLLATIQHLDGNLHLNHANDSQSEESFRLQSDRLLAARRLVEDAAAHAYAVANNAPSHSRFMGQAKHISLSRMRKDEIMAMLADGDLL